MATKAASITDVERRVGRSPATVSNALTGRKPVSPELVEKVQAAAEALDDVSRDREVGLPGTDHI